jgi:predicted nucleic acid-binding Zn ribbon protein
MFDTFHEKLKGKIMQSPEWQRLQGKAPAPASAPVSKPSFDDADDDIPF